MDYNVVKATVWIGISLMFLWDVILLYLGRRITRTPALNVSNVFIIYLVFNLLIMYPIAPLIPTVIAVALGWIFNYYNGPKYNVYSDDKKNLIMELEKAIKECENPNFEKTEVEKTITYTMAGSNKSIVLIQNAPLMSHKKNYYLQFIKWGSSPSRKKILTSLEEILKEEKVSRGGKVKLAIQLLFTIGLVIGAFYISSRAIMEPMEISGNVFQNPPAQVYVVGKDEYYTNNEAISQFHEYLKDAHRYRKDNSEISIEYGGPADLILYYRDENGGQDIMVNSSGNNVEDNDYSMKIGVNKAGGTIFIPDAYIGNKSFFHKIMWKTHSIYDKKDGNYYSIFIGDMQEWKELLGEMLEE